MLVRNILYFVLIAALNIIAEPMAKNAKIYVAGHKGLVGSSLMKSLKEKGYTNIITRTTQELDLRNQQDVNNFFMQERPEYVFLSAAKVGGIFANQKAPADFLYDNAMIALNVLHAAHEYGVKKLLYLGSSCIYPRLCEQPIKEEYLLNGLLEPTNEGYALAKILGLKLCAFFNKQYGTKFITCMPTNLYGPNDHFDLVRSHVIPALIKKFSDAVGQGKDEIVMAGSGNALREFLYIDDLSEALLFLMDTYEENTHVNIGTGQDITIRDLVHMIADLVGFKGTIQFDTMQPDGTPRKLLDVSKINALGWTASTELQEGLKRTVNWYKNSIH